MQIMVEAKAIRLQLTIKRLLSCMAERGMADVMDQRQRFHQLFIQIQRRSSRTGDLGDFNGVGQAAAEVIGVAMGENLRFSGQPPKRSRMDDPVAVALKRGTIRVRGF